jgi:hypothetical protein
MEMQMNGLYGVRLAAMLIGVVCGGAAAAQPTSDGGRNLPQPRTQAASCSEVAWDEELLVRYPRVGDGCQEVVISEGRKWARFEADFVRAHGDGRVTLDFKDRRGNSIEQITLMPARDQRVSIDGRTYRFSDLQRSQKLNVYLPEGIFAVATEPGAPLEELAEIVLPATSSLLAQAERTPGRTPALLPSTAGPLPWFALAGVLSLLGGVGLTVKRRFFARP